MLSPSFTVLCLPQQIHHFTISLTLLRFVEFSHDWFCVWGRGGERGKKPFLYRVFRLSFRSIRRRFTVVCLNRPGCLLPSSIYIHIASIANGISLTFSPCLCVCFCARLVHIIENCSLHKCVLRRQHQQKDEKRKECALIEDRISISLNDYWLQLLTTQSIRHHTKRTSNSTHEKE